MEKNGSNPKGQQEKSWRKSPERPLYMCTGLHSCEGLLKGWWRVTRSCEGNWGGAENSEHWGELEWSVVRDLWRGHKFRPGFQEGIDEERKRGRGSGSYQHCELSSFMFGAGLTGRGWGS